MRISDWSSDVCSSDLSLPAVSRTPSMCRSSRAFGHSPHQAPFASDETRCTFPCLIGTMEMRDAAFGKMAIRGERLFDRSVDRKFLCGLPGGIAECGQILARQCGEPSQG